MKKLEQEEARRLFPEEVSHAVMASVGLIGHLEKEINGIEKIIRGRLKVKKEFLGLTAMPGIGDILAMTIMLEVGSISRFPRVQDHAIVAA